MASQSPLGQILRFGVFEMNLETHQLRKAGTLIRLQLQPFKVLSVLAARNGKIVSREELRHELWGDETFVNFEQGLNYCIRQIRAVLGDEAQTPRYIETLPRQGYRFIVPLTESLNDGRPVAISEGSHEPSKFLRSRSARSTLWRRIAFGTAIAFAVAGLTWGVARRVGGSARPPIRSIAVLPLENLSNDPQQEFFVEGMTDELITTLAKINELRVTSRTSVMRYRNSRKPVSQIAKELGVDALLEGTVLRSGTKVRISAQLIHGATDRHLWAETYERDLSDILALQTEVAHDISSEIKAKLTEAEQTRLAKTYPVNTEAYDLYLKGRFHWNDRNKPGIMKAAEYFKQSIQKDPNYAPAFAGLADCYGLMAEYGVLPHADGFTLAKSTAKQALKLDNSLSEGHASLAFALWNERDWPNAEREFQRAIELGPAYATAHHWYSNFLAESNRPELALVEIKRAQELDPLSDIVGTAVGSRLFYARRYDEAIQQYRKILELDPNYAQTRSFLRQAFEEGRAFPEAIAEYQKGAILFGEDVQEVSGRTEALRSAYTRSGERGYWMTWLQFEKDNLKLGRRGQGSSSQPLPLGGESSIAILYARLGDKEEAFEWLQKACDRGLVTGFVTSHPAFDSLRKDPRFDRLVGCPGFPFSPQAQ